MSRGNPQVDRFLFRLSNCVDSETLTTYRSFLLPSVRDEKKYYGFLTGNFLLKLPAYATQQPGGTTTRAKWAFGDKAAAEAFQTQYGGALVGFEEAIMAAYEDMYQDTRMIREKRKMKRMMQTKQDDAARKRTPPGIWSPGAPEIQRSNCGNSSPVVNWSPSGNRLASLWSILRDANQAAP